jgi:hypothetical protein
MTRSFRTALAFAMLLPLLGLSLAACNNPFTPADPEPPSGDAVIEDFGSVDGLLNTTAVAIGARPNGANAYIHAFAESTTTSQRAFRGFHDQAVKAVWLQGSSGQAAQEPWTLPFERGVYSELSRIRPNDPYVFNWLPDPDSPGDDEIADVTSIHRKYQLAAIPANADPVIIMSGFADLLLQKVNGKYSIFEWRDRVDPAYGVNSPDVKTFTYHRLESQ